jgi:hypothetical protein
MLQAGYDDLRAFADTKAMMLRPLNIPEFLFDPRFNKKMERLTAGEYKAVADAIETMAKHGREEHTIEVLGEKERTTEVIDKLGGQIQEIADKGIKLRTADNRRSLGMAIRAYTWNHINVDSIVRRIDKGTRGLATRLFMDRFHESGEEEASLIREYQKKMIKVAGDLTRSYLNRAVENDLFRYQDGTPIPMTMRNVLGVLANFGNKSNLEKMGKGHKIVDADGNVREDEIRRWLEERTSKRDWERQQQLGNLFNELFAHVERLEMRVNGVLPEKIELTGVQSKYGNFKGWYHPIDYSQQLGARDPKMKGRVLEQPNYFAASVPTKYLTPRTRFFDPTELNLDIVPIRMKQMIRDIAYRETLLDVGKVIYDQRFQHLLDRHYGPLIWEQFDSLVKDTVNNTNFNNESQAIATTWLNKVMQNVVGVLIGFNPKTWIKHTVTAYFNSVAQSIYDVGMIRGSVLFHAELASHIMHTPFRSAAYIGEKTWNMGVKVAMKLWSQELNKMLLQSDQTLDARWNFAVDKSDFLQNRMQSFGELFGVPAEIGFRGGSVREKMLLLGSRPVAFFDLISAIATWRVTRDYVNKVEFRRLVNEGLDLREAATQADAEGTRAGNDAVRQAHGSATRTFKPQIMRGGALGQFFTGLYGFFNHMLQKQYEMAWRTKEAGKSFKKGEHAEALKQISKVALGLVSFVIVPAAVEEAITPYTNEEKDSWGTMAVKSIGRELSASWIGVRDLVQAAIGEHPSTPGLFSAVGKSLQDVYSDIMKADKWNKDKELASRVWRHSFAGIGMLTGIGYAQMGRTAQFIYRYNQGLEHPRNIMWDPKKRLPFQGDTLIRGLVEGKLHPR